MNNATLRASGSVQFAVSIAVPAGVNQRRSAAPEPAANRRRRNTGCARRSAMTSLVNCTSAVSTADQSNQEISLSWQ